MRYLLDILVRILVFGGLWYLFNRKNYEEERKLRINTIKTTAIFVVLSMLVEWVLSTYW